MVSVYDVPVQELINEVAKDLKTKVKEPEYTKFVKTGISRERVPDNPDWWSVRLAAILRTFYTKQNLGVNILRGYYGSRQARGAKPGKSAKGSGKVIRNAVQELEKLGYLAKTDKGRIITLKGRQYLDNVAKNVSIAKK